MLRCYCFGTTQLSRPPDPLTFSAVVASVSSDLPDFIVERQQPKHPSRTTCAVGVGIITFPALIAAKIQHIRIRIRDRFQVPVHVRAALMHWFVDHI